MFNSKINEIVKLSNVNISNKNEIKRKRKERNS